MIGKRALEPLKKKRGFLVKGGNSQKKGVDLKKGFKSKIRPGGPTFVKGGGHGG